MRPGSSTARGAGIRRTRALGLGTCRRAIAGVVMVVCAGGAARAAPLDQADLARPDRVERQLRAGVTAAERRTADAFYHQATALRDRNAGRNWGPVVKAFGESAVHRPAPPALIGYAEARLRGWPEWSNPQPDLARAKRAALREAQGVYAAALAADDIVRELTPGLRADITAWRDCIGVYLDAGRRTPGCRPLDWIAAP